MGRKPNKHHLPPSFYVILLHDFTHTLIIPCDFVNKYLKGEVIEKPILKTHGSTKSWVVKMEKMGQNYVFNKGWTDFVKDNCLERGDFLLFWLSSDSKFFVNIYDPTCCEKPLNLSTLSRENICEDKKIVSMEEDTKTKNPYYEARIPKSSISRINLVMKFVRETGVLLKENYTVLRNEQGRKWRVETCRRNNGYLFQLTKGWKDFRKENGLKESDVCSFEFCREEGNLLDIRVLNKDEKKMGSEQSIRGDEKIVSMEEATNVENPYCEVRITKSSTSTRIHLLMRFVRETGVLLKEKHTVLRNAQGTKWRVQTYLRKNGSMFELGRGWRDFRVQNGLKESDVCSFVFCREEGNLIDVRVLNNNEDKKHMLM